QREIVEPRPEGLRHDVHGVDPLEDEEEHDRHRPEAEGHRHAREEEEECGDEDDRPLHGRRHAALLPGTMPKGGSRPVTRAMSSATYWSTSRPSPAGMAR